MFLRVLGLFSLIDTYQFDLDGFLERKKRTAGTKLYNYSSRGELLSETLHDGSVVSYDHDPFGRRIAKRVNGVVVEKYLWSGRISLMAVYDGNDNLISRFNYADARMPQSMNKADRLTIWFMIKLAH